MTSAHLLTFGDGVDDETRRRWHVLGIFGGRRVGAEAYANVYAGVLEVEGVGVALRAVADDGYFFGLDEGEICVRSRGRFLPCVGSFSLLREGYIAVHPGNAV